MTDVMKTEKDGKHPASHYPVVGDPAQVSTSHLRVKGADGEPDHTLMGAAKAALDPEALDRSRAAGRGRELALVIDLTKVALSETADGLKRTPIAVLGAWVKAGDAFSFTPADFADMYRNFGLLGTDGREKQDIVVDYNHATVLPELAPGGDAPAAGWLRAIEPPQAGDIYLWGHIEWTPRAAAAIAAREYKYLSPCVIWGYLNKRTGANQGTTMVSLALTNTPFLEELPAICLTDRGYAPAPQQADPPPQQVAAAEPAAARGKTAKEKPMAKKVTVSPIKSGDNKGHLKVSHPDLPQDSDFYANKNDVAEALDDAQAMDEKAGEALSEATGLKGKTLREQLPAVKDRFATKVITLSELPTKADGPDKGAPDFAGFAPAAGTLIASEVFTAREREQILDEAVRANRIMPKDRTILRKLSLSDLREYLDGRAGNAVETGERGHGGTRGADGKEAVLSEFEQLCQKALTEKRAKTYGDAVRLVSRDNPELRKRYDESKGIKKQVG